MTRKPEAVLQQSDMRQEMITGDGRGVQGFTLTAEDATQQKLVTAHFESTANRWKTLYEGRDVFAAIFQQRLAAALAFVDKLALPPGSEILDVGCGAGLAAVALAERGHFVEAVDVAPAMLRATREHASRARIAQHVRPSLGDVHNLAFPDNTFNVVLAIGVTAWLHSLQGPLREIARVLQPGGYLIISAGNRWSLHRLLDPRLSPVMAPAKRAVRRVLNLKSRQGASQGAHYSFFSSREFDSILAMIGFKKLESKTVGFGPFSFLGRKLLPTFVEISIDQSLERLADKGVAFIRSTGRVYLVLAKKPAPGAGCTAS
jgi:ubiquinone/menaquinone biosynthesis C-methylase UbiE